MDIRERKGRKNRKKKINSVFNCNKNTGQAFFPSLLLVMSVARLDPADGMCKHSILDRTKYDPVRKSC